MSYCTALVNQKAQGILGTAIPDDAPLMGAGLDSLAAVGLVTALGDSLSTEVQSTALFDHPTIKSLGKYFSS